MRLTKVIKDNWLEILFFTILMGFSWWLMWHTFDYQGGQLKIATKAWSDFSATIPLIRSFSWGQNWPPEYPLFPGEPIRYHFLFHFLVGILEKWGLSLDWALNLPSIFGFFGLMTIIYFLAKLIFKKTAVGFLAVIFFLFNGSLAFIEFFRLHPLSTDTLNQIITSTTFASFGPYDQKIVSAFWNLNIYTNQRHLAMAYAGVLLMVFFLIKIASGKKKPFLLPIILLGILFGLYPFFHKAVFVMMGFVLGWFFLVFPKIRKPIALIMAIGSLLALPQVWQLANQQLDQVQAAITFNPGYLVEKPLSLLGFGFYWLMNLGLTCFLAPIGFFLAPRIGKKIFLGFFFLFLIGNLFQFSPEISPNHKFFNLFIIIGNIFSAWAIFLLWRKNLLGKIIAPFLILLMIFSGIIDFFPIKNDHHSHILDAPKNSDILWIKNNTSRDAVFLNSSLTFHPASLAGRKVFFGWPYFSWSLGYNTKKRGQIYSTIYETENKASICQQLAANELDYFSIENTFDDPNLPKIDLEFFKNNFIPAYSSSQREFIIFKTKQNCL